MKKQKTVVLLVNGSSKAAGVTFYTRQGHTIVRAARSAQPERRSRGQFDQRMRMRHTIALWHKVKAVGQMFGEGVTGYRRFASLANRLTPLYVPYTGPMSGASFLLPGMPVSEGTIAGVKEWLGEAEGHTALMTNLRLSDLEPREELRLCKVRQEVVGEKPRVVISWSSLKMPMRNLKGGTDEPHLCVVDGALAVVGNGLEDPMNGWALVRVEGDRCSTQTIVTRCTYYERFTTDEALEAAVKTYGGLTE